MKSIASSARVVNWILCDDWPFEEVEEAITNIGRDKDRKRLCAQRLFDRLMFIKSLRIKERNASANHERVREFETFGHDVEVRQTGPFW